MLIIINKCLTLVGAKAAAYRIQGCCQDHEVVQG